MKLDPLSVPVRAGESVVRLAWVLIFIVIGSPAFGGGAAGAAFVVAAWFVIALTYQFIYFQRFEYALDGDTLDIASGVVSRRNREIPVGRIQNVDISRNVLQRSLGLAQINLETAGGSSTEASLRYVSYQEAKRLQSELGRLKRGDDDATEERTPEHELFSVTSKELVLLGVIGIDLRLLSAVTVLLPIVAPSLRERFADPLVGLAVTAPLAAAGIVLVTALVSGVLAVMNYYGFRLSRQNDELLYERGLLQRYSGSIPLEKVQTLTISENVIARRLGYASLAVETAGYGPGEAGSQSAVPLADRQRVFDLAQSVESFDTIDYEQPPKRARERYFVRYSLLAMLVVVAAYGADMYTQLTFAWYVTIGLLPLTVIAAHLKWTNLGYDVGSEYIVLREGFWTRTITVVPYYRVQTVLDSQTILQRRRGLATLVVDTAGSSGLTNRQPRALDIDATHAAELRETVADRLQRMVQARRAQRRRERLRSIDANRPDEPTGSAL